MPSQTIQDADSRLRGAPSSVGTWNEYDRQKRGSGGYTDQAIFFRYLQGSRVLELGCGRGASIGQLPATLERFGVDLSERAIAAARRAYPGVSFAVADVTQLPFPDGFFDTVYAIEVIEHIPDTACFLREARRVLVSGGTLFLQTPNYPIKRLYDFMRWLRKLKPTPADDPTHVSRFSYRSLREAAVAEGFTVVELKTRNIFGERYVPELRALRERGTELGLMLGQKTILMARRA